MRWERPLHFRSAVRQFIPSLRREGDHPGCADRWALLQALMLLHFLYDSTPAHNQELAAVLV